MTTEQEALTQTRLRHLFDYQDGWLIHKQSRGRVKAGDKAGHIKKRGYVQIKIDGRTYKAHRLIYVWHHGFQPNIVDHIDCDPTNNRIENLRSCDKSENGMNRASSYSNTGIRNVYQRGNKYQVHMRLRGKQITVGTFSDLDSATREAHIARKRLYGEFA